MFKRKKSQEAPQEQNPQGAEQAPAASQKDKFLGFAKSHGTGTGAIIVHTDGCLQPVRGGIGEAIRLCRDMRGN